MSSYPGDEQFNYERDRAVRLRARQLAEQTWAGNDTARLADAISDLVRENVSEARQIIDDAVRGLTHGACFTCGSEPGCNIDCKGCEWVARAQQWLESHSPATGGAPQGILTGICVACMDGNHQLCLGGVCACIHSSSASR